MAALGALGGARPTGIGWFDGVLLALGGAAAAACASRARTVPVYLAAGAAALLQPATIPLALGCVALAAAFSRRFRRGSTLAGPLAGGLTWAAVVGAPGEPAASYAVVPLVLLGWVALSARRHGGRSFRSRFRWATLAVGSVMVVGTALGALSALSARADVDRGADLLSSGLAAARDGDTDAAIDDLRAARRALARGESSLGALWARPAWLVPGVSQNTRALHAVVGEVADLAGAAIRTAEDADLDRLRARQGKVDLAAVAEMEGPLSDVLAELQGAQARIAKIRDGWLLPPVQERLEEVAAEVDDAIPSARLARDGARIAPGLLGGDGPSTYLVFFTTPVEARATTGFPGNFAEVTFTNGRFDMTRFGRIGELNRGLPPGGGQLSGPADYLARYARYGPNLAWQNITLSPDFPSVAAVAAELYPQSGGRPIDGVISLDPVALAALLRFTGPVAVPGITDPLAADNAAQFLLLDQYIDLPDTPERIDALETLAAITFNRLTTVDLPGPRELGRTLGPVVEEGHLQVMAFGDDQGAFLDDLGISGRYPAVEGDFVGVTTSNAAGNKIDIFLRRSLDYDVRWDPSTGEVTATATITLTNEAPASGLPDYVIGNALDRIPLEEKLPTGWNNALLTLYTPLDHRGATIDGEPLELERIDELGRRALSTFVPIAPGASRTIVVELHGVLDAPRYVLDLAPQPQVEPEAAAVRISVAGAGELTVTGPVKAHGRTASGAFPLVRHSRVTAERR